MSQLTAFGTDGLNAQNMVERNVESTIFRYSPFNYPLSTILTNIAISDEFGGGVKSAGINKLVVDSYKVEFAEETPVTAKTTTDTAISDDTTSILSVVDASEYLVNDVIRVVDAGDASNRTTEQMLIVAIDVPNNKLTVTRGFGSIAALGSIDAGSQVVKVANAFGEASSAPAARINKSELKETYLQLFRDTVNVSEEAMDQQLVAGKAWSDEYSKKKISHGIAIETALWFSEGGFKTINGREGYLMKGIIPELKAYDNGSLMETMTGTVTETALFSFLRRGFAFGSSNKILFASGVVQDAIAQFGKVSRRIGSGDSDNKYGLNITEYVTPNGTIQVVQNPIFNEDYGFENGAVLLDIAESCDFLVHKNGATEFTEHNQTNGEMRKSGDFRTRCGLKFSKIKNNRLLYIV